MKTFKFLCMFLVVAAMLAGCSNKSSSVLPGDNFLSTPTGMQQSQQGDSSGSSTAQEGDGSLSLENSAVTGNSATLPAAETVDPSKYPYMYDFLYGCLGWHTDIRHEAWGTDTYIMRHRNAPYILFVDMYVIQDDMVFPPSGQQIERHELNATELDLFDAAVAKSDSRYIVTEGEWEFIVYNESMYNLGIRLWDAEDYTEGLNPTFIENNTGWPSSYLRREPYASRLLDKYGIDIRDEWWDTFRYSAVYMLYPTDIDLGVYYLVCTNVDEFEFHAEEVAASGERISWAEAIARMENMQYEMPGFYEDGEVVCDLS